LGSDGDSDAISLSTRRHDARRILGKQSVKFDPRTNTGDRRCECASACFFIWAAGATREGDVVGVHRPAFDPKEFSSLTPESARERYNAILSQSQSFLLKVGIPTAVIERTFAVSSAELSYLSDSILGTLRRTAPLDEQIIARCGARLTLQQRIAELVELQVNQYEWEDKSKGSPSARPKLSIEEHNQRVRAFKKLDTCQHQALEDIRRQTNALYLQRHGDPIAHSSSRDEATSLASKALEAAKIEDAVMASDPQSIPEFAAFDAAWAIKDILGWVLINTMRAM
jgi:hypothetical protein